MTPDGLQPAVRALKYWERRQQVMANNLANVSTTGFKGERVFARLLEDGGPTATTANDFSAGTVSATGRPLDVALEGDGFLVVDTASGERYVRGGSFRLDEAGKLVTERGDAVLGDDGPIVLPRGEVVVESDGYIRVAGSRVTRFRVEVPGDEPLREGANLWIPQGEGRRVPEQDIRFRQGHLEGSNVNPVSAMVEMIEIQRAYTALQKTIQTQDSVMATIASEVGRVDR